MKRLEPSMKRKAWLILRPTILLVIIGLFTVASKNNIVNFVPGIGLIIYGFVLLINGLKEPTLPILIEKNNTVIYNGETYSSENYCYFYNEFLLGLRPSIALEEKYTFTIANKKNNETVKIIKCTAFSQEDRDLLNRISKKSQKK